MTVATLDVGIGVEQIVDEYARRRNMRGELFERCRRITQAYDNDLALPLPEVSRAEAPAVANLLGSGIDQHAMRIASVLPDVQCPPVTIGQRASERRADQRRRALIGMWEANSYELLMRRRARALIAYAQTPVYLRPDMDMQQPRWEIRSPLETYPSDLGPTDMQPENCIFGFTRTVGWLRQTYPQVNLRGVTVSTGSTYTPGRRLRNDDPIDLIQWLDDTQFVLMVMGEGQDEGTVREAEYGIQGARIINLGPAGGVGPRRWACELQRVENRAGVCPVVVPGRITLAGLKGQFDDSIGLYQMQAKLQAMEVNAVANSIWPDQWMVSAPGQVGQIITQADGRRGVIGQITGATLDTTQVQPGLQTPTTIDRLERGIRLSASIPADFGGESASNVRTARRGQAILGEAVDYTIQEHQQILARSMQHEGEIAAAIDLTYFRNLKKSFYVSWKGGKGRLDYTPKDIWSEDRTIRVSYAKAGADVNALSVEIGQKIGIGTMSKLTGQRMDPDIVDPEFEADQVIYEALQAAALSGIQQGAASGSLPLVDIATIADAVRQDKKSLFDAVRDAQQAAQERQSSTVAPADPGSPEAQPGLSAPDQGAEAGGPIAAPGPSSQNLVALLRGLRTTGQIAAQGPPQ